MMNTVIEEQHHSCQMPLATNKDAKQPRIHASHRRRCQPGTTATFGQASALPKHAAHTASTVSTSSLYWCQRGAAPRTKAIGLCFVEPVKEWLGLGFYRGLALQTERWTIALETRGHNSIRSAT